MLAILLVSGVSAANVFTKHTSPAVRILIPAHNSGFAPARTRLDRRFTFVILRLFEPSCLGLTTAWVISGIVLSALTPPITVRTAIRTSIAVSGHKVRV
jgi:hypothetical protein